MTETLQKAEIVRLDWKSNAACKRYKTQIICKWMDTKRNVVGDLGGRESKDYNNAGTRWRSQVASNSETEKGHCKEQNLHLNWLWGVKEGPG